MIRVVIDTNSLLVTIAKKSRYRPIFDALRKGDFQLLLTTEILSEYAEVFEQRMNAVVSFNVIELISQLENASEVEVYYKWHLINTDVDDNKFVDCAVNGGAKFIVTDDRHFDVLSKVPFPSVEVIKTREFNTMVLDGVFERER